MSNDLSAQAAEATINQMSNSVRGQPALNRAPAILPEISRTSFASDDPPSASPSTPSAATTPVPLESESEKRVRNLIMWIDEWGGLCDKLTEKQLYQVRAAIAQNSYERRMFRNPIATVVSFVLFGAIFGSLLSMAARSLKRRPCRETSQNALRAMERQFTNRQ